MRRFAFLAGLFLALLPASAAELPSVEVVNLAAFKAASFGAYVHLQGIVKPGDGNDAYYTQNGFVCTPDDYSIIKDAAGHCYFRGASASPGIPIYASLAAVQAIGPNPPAEIQTTSYILGLGKGGARYTWNAASVATDCAHVQVTGIATGRYVLRADLNNNTILPTQCGAYFDNSHDDVVAWQATEDIAAATGWIIGCQPGTSRIGNDYIRPGAGVVHRGCGVGIEIINQANALIPAFYIQNANGTGLVQGPAFYDLTISCTSSSASYSCVQFNSISGGFTDTVSTQSYMWQPIMERVEVTGSGTKGGTSHYPGSTSGQDVAMVQCSKCFEGKFENNHLHGGQAVGFDIEGSDFVSVSHNRVIFTTGIPIQLIAQGTFSNYDVVDHNDLLSPTSGVDSYIYSSAREARITFNGIEGPSTPNCMIHLAGGYIVTVADNGLNDSSAGCGIRVDTDTFYKLDIHGNSTISSTIGNLFSNGGGASVYIAGGGAVRQNIVHYNNGNESGIPFSVVSTPDVPTGMTLLDITPNSYLTANSSNYGGTLRVKSLAGFGNLSPAWVIPVIAGTGSLVTFPDQNMSYLKGTISICLKGYSGTTGQVLNLQLLDNGSPIVTTTTAFSDPLTGTPLICPTALQHVAVTTNATLSLWNNDTTHSNANVYIYEIIFNNG